jgi:hypothetical protein
MILGVPAVDGHDLTDSLIKSLREVSPDVKIVIINNGSDVGYGSFIGCDVINNKENIGFYRPLQQLYDRYPDEELIGLIHNDMVIYEYGWDTRMAHSFAMDDKLALVGMCGSSEIDDRGGRGGGTVCFFRGGQVIVGDKMITGQNQAAGRRTTDLVPSACLDSLFMMFRREAIPDLVTSEDPWEDITLAHFYDRIWPVRLIEKGWHVATLGVEVDHLGGMTSTGNMRYREDCIKWLDERGIAWRINDNGEGIIAAEANDTRNIPSGNPETSMYLVAERRYLDEYRDQKHFIPCRIHGDYRYERLTA